MQEAHPKGQLFLVPTPVGNLEDITLRAIRVLKEADAVLSEDTRTTGMLFKHLDISNKLNPFHQHNEHLAVDHFVKRMKNGETLALVSDAGTPGISDPGFLLVRACVAAGVKVECLPGPTAFVPALVCSGLPCDRFVFEGFLPLKKGRQTRLKLLAEEDRTIVLYESPHRIVKSLAQFVEYFGPDRQIAVVREISKMYEEAIRGTTTEVLEHFQNNAPRGEFVVVIGGKD